jgi:hypothetical protein
MTAFVNIKIKTVLSPCLSRRFFCKSRNSAIPMSPSPPLTTLFVPPNSCLTDVYWYSFTSGQTPQVLGTGIGVGSPGQHYLGLPGSSGCLPTGWAPCDYYSPGICPGGYTIACSSSHSVGGTVTETVATCCPR